MRIAFLFLLIACGYAADERFTLLDGRVLVGTYNETTKVLSFTINNIKGSATVQLEEIVRRDPLTPPEPERDVRAENQRLDQEHIKQAEELRRRQAADAAALRKSTEEAERKLKEKEAAERAQVEALVAERLAANARRDAENQRIAAEAAAQLASELQQTKAQAERRARDEEALRQQRITQAEAERRSEEQAHIDSQKRYEERKRLADLQRQQEADAMADRAARGRRAEILQLLAIITVGIIALTILALLWFWPYRIAKRRGFSKARDVRMILIICIFLPGLNLLGWLATMMWVLIASTPPKAET